VEKAGGSMTPLDAYTDLCYYTLALRDPSFLHQHVVDAFAAQNADEHTKPMKVSFALVGLYLHVEKQFSGRRVQQMHMELARHKHPWPSFPLPGPRGSLTAADVMVVPAGLERDKAIDAWCASVWEAFRECRPGVIKLLQEWGFSWADFSKPLVQIP
jgi:hypothetical protein